VAYAMGTFERSGLDTRPACTAEPDVELWDVKVLVSKAITSSYATRTCSESIR